MVSLEQRMAPFRVQVRRQPQAESRKRRDGLQEWLDATLRPWFEGRILPVTAPIAERWGVLSGECRSQGKQVKVADGLIVATALQHKLTIVTRNVKDFAGLGATVLNPWDEA